jgi:hypothetical protein
MGMAGWATGTITGGVGSMRQVFRIAKGDAENELKLNNCVFTKQT